MLSTQPVTFDPAATQAWLRQPGGTHAITRAERLGVDEDVFGRGLGDFLATIADILAAKPAGWRHRADITAIALWLIPDGEVLGRGALITVNLSNGVCLASLRQDAEDFADRDQRGIPAALSALAHIADQVGVLLAGYQAANPSYPATAQLPDHNQHHERRRQTAGDTTDGAGNTDPTVGGTP